MTQVKFVSESTTLKKFFTVHCKNKHTNQRNYIKDISYKNSNIKLELDLCDECTELINYSIERLRECPHEIKPRCRTCSNPCYEKPQWKKLAKLMRYSGIQLGILKIKKFFRF